jgi:hypothetical protein
MANVVLYEAPGGRIELPQKPLVLVDRADGGALIVMPPRPVWDRTEMTADELCRFSLLVAAAAKAMLDTLPQLEGGCINYWDAGNWALNEAAEPPGPKRGPDCRRMHLHLLGRSPRATSPSWKWGESPVFPAYRERFTWGAAHQALNSDEADRVVARARQLLDTRYRLP